MMLLARITLLLTMLAPGWLLASPPACADEPETVVVIRDDHGKERTYCVATQGDGMSGIDALRATGLTVTTRSFGGTLGEAICSIGETGRERGCPSGSGYWHYWLFKDGRWVSSELGPSSTVVRPGDHQGWAWTSGPDASPPRTVSFRCREPLPENDTRPDVLTFAAAGVGLGILAIPVLHRRLVNRRAG